MSTTSSRTIAQTVWIAGYMAAMALLATAGLIPFTGTKQATKEPSPMQKGAAASIDPARQALRAIAIEFASNQFRKAERIAQQRKETLPAEFITFYRAAMRGDMETTSNMFDVLDAQSGTISSTSDRLETPEWPTIDDTYAACAIAANADPVLTEEFARRIYAVIPSNGVYFGGTNPGRFVITAFQHALGRDDVSVITQNGLASANYVAYLRYSVARDHAVFIPSDEDVKAAFEAHTRDVKTRRKRGEQTEDVMTVVNGKIVKGTITGVMWVNGVLARMIFERNTNAHAFCLEESYIIHWMYPYLEPAGLILRLQPTPVTITPAMVVADSNYWAELTATIGPILSRDSEAKNAFSKCRCASAGVYEYHKMFAEAEHAYREAVALNPASAEANMRLASLLMKLERYDDAISQAESYQRSDPKNTRVAGMIAAIKEAKIQAQKRGKRDR